MHFKMIFNCEYYPCGDVYTESDIICNDKCKYYEEKEMTFDEQVETVIEWYEKAPKKVQEGFSNTPKEKLIRFHESLGRDIRNRFNLWENKWTPKIEGGIDVSEDHPDSVSMRIIEAVWEKVNGKKQEEAKNKVNPLREALEFIASQKDKTGNWAVEIAKRALKDAEKEDEGNKY